MKSASMFRLVRKSRFRLVNLWRYYFDFYAEGDSVQECWFAHYDDYGPSRPPLNAGNAACFRV